MKRCFENFVYILVSPLYTFQTPNMKNSKLLVALLASVVFISASCSKENNVSYSEGSGQNGSGNAVPQSVMFNNIAIDSLGKHVFSVSEITQAVLSRGSVTVYAATCGSAWTALPIINSCDSRIDVTNLSLGQVEVQSTLGGSVIMSFRIDVVGN
jgi:hypothetical protein